MTITEQDLEAAGEGFDFPCEYPVKAMGPNTPEFKAAIVDVVKPHAPEVSSNSVHCKTSKTGKYQSVTVLVYFLNHVPSSIRINAVLEGIGRRLLNAIRDNFDEPMKARVEGEVREGTPVFAR